MHAPTAWGCRNAPARRRAAPAAHRAPAAARRCARRMLASNGCRRRRTSRGPVQAVRYMQFKECRWHGGAANRADAVLLVGARPLVGGRAFGLRAALTVPLGGAQQLLEGVCWITHAPRMPACAWRRSDANAAVGAAEQPVPRSNAWNDNRPGQTLTALIYLVHADRANDQVIFTEQIVFLGGVCCTHLIKRPSRRAPNEEVLARR